MTTKPTSKTAIPLPHDLRHPAKLLVAGFAGLCLLVAMPAADAATYTVTTTADSGAGSLRQAIADANASPGADSISFGVGVAGQTIQLGTVGDNTFGPTALVITSAITIEGGAGRIRIARDTNSAPNRLRLFYVTSAGNLTLRNVTLSGGLARGTDGDCGGGAGAGLGGPSSMPANSSSRPVP